ncbi:Ig-like domain repeat protein [Nocardioides yefusunii]|uniref:Ig-like domain repeat protein n=1 Tax=Nocardioides yefusunii TaxID=2500546 RepID=UPI0013E2CA46|nr:Ig-like domain repeat protein [Nocardioides yefusunii]
MRNRITAGLAASALVSSVLAAPVFMSSAVAAPASASAGVSIAAAAVTTAGSPLVARSFGAELVYNPGFSVTQLDQAITIKQAALPTFSGPPASVTVSKIQVDAVFDLNGTDVPAQGSSTPRGTLPFIGSGLALPELKFDLPFGSPAGELELKSYKVTLTTASGDSAIDFTVNEPVRVGFDAVSDPALLAKYSTYALGVGDGFRVAQDGGKLSLAIEDFPKLAAIPAMVTVSKVKLDAVLTLGETEIPFTGTSIVDPATPMSQGFAFPAITGTLPAGTPAGELKLKSISAVVTAFNMENDIEIDIRRDVTVEFAKTPSTLEARAFGASIGHEPNFVASQLDQAVTIKQAAFPTFSGPPASVTVSKIQVDAVFDLNGTDVPAQGSSTPRGTLPFIGSGLALPELKFDLPFGSPAGELELKSYKVTLTTASGDSAIDFTVNEPVRVGFDAVSDPALLAKYSTYALGVGDGFRVAQDGGKLSLAIEDFPKLAAIPAMVTVSKVKLDAVLTLGETEIPFTGTSIVDPATPMSQGFAFPAITGTLPAGTPAGELKLKSISAVVTAFNMENDIEIDIRRDVTVPFAAVAAEPVETPAAKTDAKATVKATAANTVTVQASVAPAAAGEFQVVEGTKVVAKKAAVAGKATITLTNVKKGTHSYVVKFVPADAKAFTGSETSAIKVAVVDKAASKTTVKVTNAKIGKKATVKATVKAGKKAGAGKVVIKVTKKGVKKAVVSKTVTLKKNGTVSLKTPKLKKGTYTVTISYKGNGTTKTSKVVKKVTVKKK